MKTYVSGTKRIMAAIDYVIVTGSVSAYIAKKANGKIMSQDIRPIVDNEILGLFEFYLRKWYDESKKDTVFICDRDNKLLFKATLLDL